MIAQTPEPPYYAVIFTSLRTDAEEDYGETAERMWTLASEQPGFLGAESARAEVGITVSYWTSLESIAAWKANAEHTLAQERGRSEWYSDYAVRVCRVERAYGL
jgi:heme-degrading monooxygenase HmoA